MTETISLRHGVRVWVAPADGPELATEQDAVDLMASLYWENPELLAIPVTRFPDRFFDMNAKLIGFFVSKITGARVRLAIVGDIARFVEASDVLRDVVREANRGRHVWFVTDLDELDARLAR